MTKQLDLTKLDLMDALDLAILIEQEAMERYEELTAVMREHRTEEAASFFHFMAKAEAKHGADLLNRAGEALREDRAPRRPLAPLGRRGARLRDRPRFHDAARGPEGGDGCRGEGVRLFRPGPEAPAESRR